MNNEDIVLLKAEEEQFLMTEDVQIILYNCSQSYASKVLGDLWKKGLLKRRRIKKKFGGKKYKYWLSEKGEKLVKWLKEQE